MAFLLGLAARGRRWRRKRLATANVAAKLRRKLESPVVEPINLNKVRKARDKAAAKARASENRVVFGRTKAQKDVATFDATKAREKLDAARRDPPA